MKIYESRFRSGPMIDMTTDGRFTPTGTGSVVNRTMGAAIVAAVVLGALALAAFLLWVALALIPLALGAAAIAWGAWRFRLWRNGRSLVRRQGSYL